MKNRLSVIFDGSGHPMGAPPGGSGLPPHNTPPPGPVKKRPVSASISGPIDLGFAGAGGSGGPAGLASVLRSRAGTTLSPSGSGSEINATSSTPPPASAGPPPPPAQPITIVAGEAKGKEATLTLSCELTVRLLFL